MEKQFKLTHQSMNHDCAYVLGLILKLAYALTDIQQPELQIFEDTSGRRDEEWDVYGAPADIEEDTTIVKKLKFSKPSDIQSFNFDGREFRIKYLSYEKVSVDYPRDGKKQETCYSFTITQIR